VLFCGCALTEDRIRLSYQPDQGATRIAGAEGITTVVTVIDARADRSRVGAKKNGFGMEMAAIRPEEEVAATVQAAVESELRARGFRIGREGNVTISLEITRFWNDFKMGMWAGDAVSELMISAKITERGGAVLYVRNLSAEGKEADIQLASGSNAKLALDRALENGVRQLFADPKFADALLHVPSS
jgi:uncharacterized lipoprotein